MELEFCESWVNTYALRVPAITTVSPLIAALRPKPTSTIPESSTEVWDHTLESEASREYTNTEPVPRVPGEPTTTTRSSCEIASDAPKYGLAKMSPRASFATEDHAPVALFRVNTYAPTPTATATAVSPWIATRFPYSPPSLVNTPSSVGSNTSSMVITAWDVTSATYCAVSFAAGGSAGDGVPGDGATDESTGAPLMFRLTTISVSTPLNRSALGPCCGGGGAGNGGASTGGGGGGGAGAATTARFTPASHKTSARSDEETTVISTSKPCPEGSVLLVSIPPSSNAQYATKES
mmetsp:Transcript_8515/g.31863  ORF Transcript_8515/g.31863 Transcript_8515/m.31863 type:complete len:294 (+) Transcript_8515:7921-8802(+)